MDIKGLTDKEVKEMLKYYGAPEAFDETKKWYDGYRFGNEDIYCPWDVINHAKKLLADPKARPQAYWINTSGNPGMAKGGSGDVLAGLITSFLGQKQLMQSGRRTAEWVAGAVWFHGSAGDKAAQKFGEYGMTPEDLIACIPETLKEREQ